MMQRTGTTKGLWGPRRQVAEELRTIHDRLVPDRPAGAATLAVLEDRHRDALSDMVRRCSDETLRRRFHSSLGPLGTERAVELLTAGAVAGVVAEADHGAVAGVATLHRTRTGVVDFAVIVEDAWQAVGLGHRLTSRVIGLARELGFSVATADVLRQPAFVLAGLTRNNRDATVDLDGPVATVRIPLEAAVVGRLPGAAAV